MLVFQICRGNRKFLFYLHYPIRPLYLFDRTCIKIKTLSLTDAGILRECIFLTKLLLAAFAPLPDAASETVFLFRPKQKSARRYFRRNARLSDAGCNKAGILNGNLLHCFACCNDRILQIENILGNFFICGSWGYLRKTLLIFRLFYRFILSLLEKDNFRLYNMYLTICLLEITALTFKNKEAARVSSS